MNCAIIGFICSGCSKDPAGFKNLSGLSFIIVLSLKARNEQNNHFRKNRVLYVLVITKFCIVKTIIMHVISEPNILYFGTPVILIGTTNENASYNLAPMSSAFWLGWRCVIGLAAAS